MRAAHSLSSGNDVLAALDVIPDDVAVQVAPRCEEYPPLRRFRKPVSEANILGRLVPAIKQEQVDDDPLASAEQPLAQGRGLGAGVWRIEEVQPFALEVGGRQ